MGLLAASAIAIPIGRSHTDAAAACQVDHPPVGAPFLDCSLGATLNIVPPGSTGLYNAIDFAKFEAGLGTPKHTRDQEPLYANLLKVAPNVTGAQLLNYYKDASFYSTAHPGDRTESIPLHAGTVIIRDAAYGVPHIFGATRYDTEFGSGYASAEDRLFMMDVLRHYGRGQLSSFIGPSPSTLAMDCGIDRVAGYSEGELQAMVDTFPARHNKPIVIAGRRTTEGAQILADGQAYVDGVNAYIERALTDPLLLPVEYPALQVVPAPWSLRDIVATATLVQAIFAFGGGNETGSALFYESLVNRYGAAKGSAMWHDFRSQNDPEAQVSIPNEFDYEHVPATVDPNSLAMPLSEPASDNCNGGPLPQPTTGLGQVVVGPVTIDLRSLMINGKSLPRASNELIVTAAHSATTHPIAVFGPQTGYFAPEILHEIDLHGPGLQARGVSFPGTEVFVELGRGVDYAWSATSAGADIIDQRLEKLCNTDGSPPTLSSKAYVYNGRCLPMYERTDRQVVKTTASGMNPPGVVTIQIERTVHGPVVGRTTARDPVTHNIIPVAVSSQRSTFGDELGSAPAFLEWNDPDIIHGPTDFQLAAGEETGTFNWTYVDAQHVGYYMAGLLPVRNPNVDPNFPTWGTGQYEWQGFVPGDLSAADVHPRIIDPASGYFANWNNKPAPGFSAADDQFAYGPVYRVQSLAERLASLIANGRLATVSDVVNAMEDGGTVDLDGAQLVPQLTAALAGAPLTAAQQSVLNILDTWVVDPHWTGGVPGAHRRDRSGSGSYEQGNAVAIMDALYPRLAHAVFDPWLNAGQFGQLQGIMGLNNPPGATGSAYDGGWEGYLQRALRQAVDPLIANPYSQSYCGGGSLTACQTALQAALQGTIAALTSAYGTADPTQWTCSRSNKAGQCNPASDDIHFSAVGVGTVPNMPWVNRPTFQQVVSYPAQRQ